MVDDRDCIDQNKQYVNIETGVKKYGDDLYYGDEEGLVNLLEWETVE